MTDLWECARCDKYPAVTSHGETCHWCLEGATDLWHPGKYPPIPKEKRSKSKWWAVIDKRDSKK